MSDFNIAIKVDAGSSKTSIDGVHDALAKTEGAASKTNAALGETTKHLDSVHAKSIEVEGSLGQALGQRFGEFGSVLGEVAGKGTLATAGLVGLGVEAVHIIDDFTRLSNTALRLHDSTHSLSETIGEQVDLAGRMHTSLEQTMELTIAVRERTEDLNLTDRERLDLTEKLGQASILSGHGAGDAAGAFERLSFALENGLPAGRALKTEFLQFPEVAKAMSEHLHMSEGQLIAFANSGKLSIGQVVDSIKDSKEIAADFAKRGVTIGEMWNHGMDEVKTSVYAAGGVVSDFAAEMAGVTKYTHSAKEAWDAFALGMSKGEVLNRAQDILELDNALTKFGKDATDIIGKVAGKFKEGTLFDPWGNTKPAQIHAVTEEMREEQKVMKELYGTEEELNLRLDALHHLLDRGRINWLEYRNAMQEAIDKAREAKGLGLASATRGVEIQAPNAGEQDLITAGLAGVNAGLHDKERAAVFASVYDVGPILKFKNEMIALDQAELRHEITAEDHVKLLGELRYKFDDIKTPADEYRHRLEMITLKQQEQVYTAEEATRATEALNRQFDRSASQGVRNGLEEIRKQAGDTAADIAKVMTGAFEAMNKSIINLVMTGKADFHDLFDTIQRDAANAALHKLESGIFGKSSSVVDTAAITAAMAAGGATAGAAMTTGTATGGAIAGGEVAAAMTAAGALVATEIGAAIATQGAIGAAPDTMSGGFQMLADAFGGGSTGGSFDIPHAAHGFAGIVRHQSGEDTHLAMFHVKAGEHVAIRTPEQQQAAQAGGHTVVQPVVRVTNVVDQRRDLADAMHGPDGLQAITNHIGQNRNTFRALLGIK